VLAIDSLCNNLVTTFINNTSGINKAIGMPHNFLRFIADFYCSEKVILPLVNSLTLCGNIETAICGKFGARIGD